MSKRMRRLWTWIVFLAIPAAGFGQDAPDTNEPEPAESIVERLAAQLEKSRDEIPGPPGTPIPADPGRWHATYRLGQMGPAAAGAVEALAGVLADPERIHWEYVRTSAAWALGRIGPEAVPAVGPLTKTLASRLPSVRRHSARALGRIGPAALEAIPALTRSLGDEDHAVRINAALALWQIDGHPQAVPALVDLLQEETPTTAYRAAVALGEIGPDAESAADALVEALGHGDGDVRRVSARTLGRMGQVAIPSLRETLNRRESIAGRGAVEALGWMTPSEETIALLIGTLADPSPIVRASAARALGRFGPEAAAATSTLIQAVNDPEAMVRDAAARALGRIRKPASQGDSMKSRDRAGS